MCLRLAGVACLVIASAAILLAAREVRSLQADAPSLHQWTPCRPGDAPRVTVCKPKVDVVPPPPRRIASTPEVQIESETAFAPSATPNAPVIATPAVSTAETRTTFAHVPWQAQPAAESDGDFTRHVTLPVAHLEPGEVADRPLVRFAAGAVELRTPAEWSVLEMPVGREVRTVLTPLASVDALESLGDGMWLVFHPRPESHAPLDLNDVLPDRLKLATEERAWPGHSESLTIDGQAALRQWFVIEGEQAGKPAYRGYHLFADSEWGLFELHAVAPEAAFDERAEQFDRILKSLRLSSPQQPPHSVAPHLEAARPILGSWKALGSRMRIHADGRIAIVLDEPQLASGSAKKAKRPQVLSGRFEAEGDVLRVTWNDGSLLNFRWRRQGNDLLLTDHRGQISQLQLLLE